MKLSQQVILLVITCMLIGIMSASYVFWQAQNISTSQNDVQQLINTRADNKNTEMMLSQWLITLDLFLVNKQTYLFNALEEQATTIAKTSQKDNFMAYRQLRERLEKVMILCRLCQQSDPSISPKMWDKALIRSDIITENILKIVSDISSALDAIITEKQVDIMMMQEAQNSSLYSLFTILILITYLALRFANSQIVMPIEELTQLARKSNIHSNEFPKNGSHEVKLLSKSLHNHILAVHKSKEIALAESRHSQFTSARIRNIMQTAGDAIICTDNAGIIVEMNLSFHQLTGVDDKHFPCGDFTQYMPGINFKSSDQCTLHCAEMTFISQTGKKIPVELSSSSFKSEDQVLYTFIIRNISQKKDMQSKLMQAQKLESIGRLAAGIAHEINTPAQYIMDYNHFIKNSFDSLLKFLKKAHSLKSKSLMLLSEELHLDFLEAEIPNALKGSLYGLEQISHIVKSVKGFAHPTESEKIHYNLNSLMNDTVQISKNEWKYDAEIILDLQDNLPEVPCFPGRLNQVFLNLILNSAQAIHEKQKDNDNCAKGKIHISSYLENEFVHICIEDSGNGISDEIKEKIFDPFFTTKDIGVGSGQGLAIAYDLVVNKHQGDLKLSSDAGQGAKFIISIPVETELLLVS
ncbi:MAG: PAS domain S-box protein [Lentisphaeraceae bacterium]|nr:PAS domain S-box protein [Lentisphaeraceae bacterium]